MPRVMNKEQIKKEKDAKNKIVANKKKEYNKPRKYPEKKKESSTQKRSRIKRAAAKNAAIKCNPFIREFPDKHKIVEINDRLLDKNAPNKKRKAIIVAEKKNSVALSLLKSRKNFDSAKHMAIEDTPHYKKDGTTFAAYKNIDTQTYKKQKINKTNIKQSDLKLGSKDSKKLDFEINTKSNREKVKKLN